MMMLRFIILTIFLAAAGTAAAQEIETPVSTAPALKPSATVNDEVVRIGDLIINAGDAADIPIFRAPDLGNTGTLSVARIIEALRPHYLLGIDTRGITDISVTRTGRSITQKNIESHIARLLVNQYKLGKVEMLSVNLDRNMQTFYVDPSMTGDLKITRANYYPRTNRFDVAIEIPGNSTAQPMSLRFSGTAVETVEAAVILRPLAKGEVIKSADVVIERKPKAESFKDAIDANDPVIGFAASQPLRPGQVLRRSDLMKPELVHRNDIVVLTYEVPGILLTFRGKAIDSGTEGDLIAVLNPESKRTIYGTVTGPGRATVTATLTHSESTASAALIPPVATARRRTE
jgi:flagella basal body P-ring formation protein FlgA